MASSSDNYLASLDPWCFNSIFPTEPWLSETFNRETDAITKALTKTFCVDDDDTIIANRDYTPTFPFNTEIDHEQFFTPSSSSSPINDDGLSEILRTTVNPSSYYYYNPTPILTHHQHPQPTTHHDIPSTAPTPPPQSQQSLSVSVSAGSGSDPDSTSAGGSKRVRTVVEATGPPPKRIVKKRKSRVSKKSATTFIAADASNFREMVQQVTGVNFTTTGGGSGGSMVLRPEPLRVSAPNLLPTLDTSAYLIDNHHQQQHHRQQSSSSGTAVVVKNSTATTTASRSGFDFDSYASCFPTLESWKVM